jgi:hypothetical protein
VGGVLIAAGATGVLAWWVPAAQAHTALPWPVYFFGGLALVGVLLALAPLLRVGPWWDRNALLRACYNGGRALQKALAEDKSFDTEKAETQARYSVCRWAEKTWKVLKKGFPGHEQGFFGPGKMVLAETPSAFDLYCQNEIEQIGSADAFLTQKLQYVENLLRKDDSQ